jgi:vancomycin resistance protein VanJ
VHKRSLGVLVGIVGLALGCARHSLAPAARESGVPPRTSLRVLTYNVFVGNPDLEATARLVRKVDADVVALQETIPSIETALRASLSDLYPYMEFHVGPIGNGPGILSKLPWSTGKYVPSQAGLNGFWIGVFDLAGRKVQLVNAHLHPSAIDGFNPFAAKRAYDEGEVVRQAQVDELFSFLAAGQPTLLLGDLNSLPGSPTLAHLRALGLDDALAGTEAGTTATFRISALGFHIDHVLVTPGLSCTKPVVLPEGTSDHFPLAATLAWAPPS